MEQQFAYNMKDISLDDTPALPADFVHAPQTKASDVEGSRTVASVKTKLVFMAARGIELSFDNLYAEYAVFKNPITRDELVELCIEADVYERLLK